MLEYTRDSGLIRSSWVDFLQQTPWEWFSTLTFAPSGEYRYVGYPRARRAIEVWGNDITRHGGESFAVMERGTANDRIHWHCLTRALQPSIELAGRNWQYAEGFIQLEPLRSSEGGSLYITKYLTDPRKGKDEMPWYWFKPEVKNALAE